MRSLSLAFLLFCGVLTAAAQPAIGPEVASNPLAPTEPTLLSRVALTHGEQGTVIAWVSGADTYDARVFVSRVDATNHVIGPVRQMPIVYHDWYPGTLGESHATSPSIAILGDRTIVSWMEIPPLLFGTKSVAVCMAILDRDLNVVTADPLGIVDALGPSFARAVSDGYWIVARDRIWFVTPDGRHGTPMVFGRVVDDVSLTNGTLQITAHRLESQIDHCACGVASHWGCGCPVYKTVVYLYALNLFGSVDEQLWPIAGDQPIAIGTNDGKDALLVWFAPDSTVMAMRVPPSLPIQGTWPRISLGNVSGPSRAAVATDGERYVIVWQTQNAAGDEDIEGASIEPGGAVTQFSVANSPAMEHDASIVATGNGEFLVAYRTSLAGEERIAGRIVTFRKRVRAIR